MVQDLHGQLCPQRRNENLTPPTPLHPFSRQMSVNEQNGGKRTAPIYIRQWIAIDKLNNL
jgi:hypothetical protein